MRTFYTYYQMIMNENELNMKECIDLVIHWFEWMHDIAYSRTDENGRLLHMSDILDEIAVKAKNAADFVRLHMKGSFEVEKLELIEKFKKAYETKSENLWDEYYRGLKEHNDRYILLKNPDKD